MTEVNLRDKDRQDLREEIRSIVEREQLTYNWLIFRLAQDGLMTDKSEVSNVLSGARCGPKADRILLESLHILQIYQARL